MTRWICARIKWTGAMLHSGVSDRTGRIACDVLPEAPIDEIGASLPVPPCRRVKFAGLPAAAASCCKCPIARLCLQHALTLLWLKRALAQFYWQCALAGFYWQRALAGFYWQRALARRIGRFAPSTRSICIAPLLDRAGSRVCDRARRLRNQIDSIVSKHI